MLAIDAIAGMFYTDVILEIGILETDVLAGCTVSCFVGADKLVG